MKAGNEEVADEVREHRRSTGACFVCGGLDHKSFKCPEAQPRSKDYTSAGKRFNRDNSEETAFAITLLECMGLHQCPKELASEIWHNDEDVIQEKHDTIKHFEHCWDRFYADGHEDEHGIWITKHWSHHWIHSLSTANRISVMSMFPTSFTKSQYEEEVCQGIRVGTPSPINSRSTMSCWTWSMQKLIGV